MGRNTKNVGNHGEQWPPRLRTPEDVLAYVPYLLGHHPSESFVALAIDASGYCSAGLRCDLLDPDDGKEPNGAPGSGDAGRERAGGEGTEAHGRGRIRDQAAFVAAALRKRQAVRTVVIVYSASPSRGSALAEPLCAELAAVGIRVSDVLWADGRRWRSLLCPNSLCCPPEGRPYDLGSHPVTAHAVYRGEIALANEEELRASVAPLLGKVRARMLEVTAEVLRELGDAYPTIEAAEAFRRDGTAYVTGLLDRCVEQGRPPTDHEIARTSVFLRDLLVRDAAWLRMRRENAKDHLAFWRTVARRAAPPFDVGPTALLAFAAWLAGNGVLARCALERVFASDPTYSMAYVVREALAGMVPPSMWPPDVDDEQAEKAA